MRGESIDPEGPLVEPLTRREQQVLRLLAEGHSAPEIAEQFTVSLSAVKFHIQNVYSKLGANSKRQALTRAAELGLLGPSATPPMADPEPQPDPQPDPQPGPLPSLPLALTRFIGREKEIAEVRGLLSQARLVTLTGAGGSGKTRLALEAAGGLLDAYSDGVWLVELAPLAEAGLVPQGVAAALGLREIPGRPVNDILLDHLRRKQLLLVLDNCEHLVQACAELAESLLRACAQLTILATSREALNIAGETTFLVPTLASPTDHDLQSVAALGRYEAVRLFVDRAQAGQPGFQLASSNARAVGQVCRQLDGIPLAIELAAARMKVMGIDEIAAGLDNRFQLLRGGSRTALPRHQTLQALIDWSYDLLSEPERALLRRLAVFAGGWTLEAARAVGVGEAVDAGAVLDLLSQLVSKSLVNAQHAAGRPTRYSMLETIRQYALARLESAGETGGARQRHAAYYLMLSETETHDLDSEWLRLMEHEFDNLWAAIAWEESAAGSTRAALRLALATNQTWGSGGHGRESVLVCERALALPDAGNYPLLQAQVLLLLGRFAMSDYPTAYALMTHSLQLVQALGATEQIADVLAWLARLAAQQGDTATARLRFEESLALFRQTGNQFAIGYIFINMGEEAVLEEDVAEAKRLLEEALAINRAVGNDGSIGETLIGLGQVALLEGDDERAARLYEEGLTQCLRVTGRWKGVFGAHHGLAEVALAQNNGRSAARHCRENLTIFRDDDAPIAMGWCLAGLAGAAVLDEEPERAARLWGAAEALRTSIGGRHAPASRANRERLMADARQQLGEAAFAAAWAEGATLTLEQAVAEALTGQDE